MPYQEGLMRSCGEMSVSLLLTGSVPQTQGAKSEPDLSRIQRWIRAHCAETLMSSREAEDFKGRPALYVLLHPAAEEIEFVRTSPGTLAVAANTSTAGPGYHIFLCDLLVRLGEYLEVTWDAPDGAAGDETGYFHNRDAAAVDAAMLAWLQSVATILLADLSTHNGQLLVCMRSDRHFDPQWRVVSPLGPLDPEWVERVVATAETGRDFFAWWNHFQDADYFLRRALCLMWTEVRWRAPLSEAEGRVLAEAAAMLDRAYGLDPTREYPWREWRELLGYGSLTSPVSAEVFERAAAPQSPGAVIGYRRFDVRVDLAGNWSIQIPGSFAESWEDERTWYAWDATRAVRFSCFSIVNEDGTPQDAGEILGDSVEMQETFEHAQEGLLGRAHLAPSVERQWQLHGRTAVHGALAVSTITLASLEDREWALEVWRSLQRSA